MTSAATCSDPEIIILSEASQRPISYTITYMQNLLKHDTNEHIYKIETDLRTQKTNLWLPKRKGKGRDKLGGWD